ncbi:MAG: M48 family metalloprotease [Chloroflexi bacterium]|nr:M48 family metalloprotease [Chloroflexota bacterium]
MAHGYGLATQSTSGRLGDWLKAASLALGPGLVAVEVLVLLIAWSPSYWWLWATMLTVAFTIAMAGLAPILLVPLFFLMRPLEDDELSRRLARLASTAGVKLDGVYRIELSRKSSAANAALMGLGNTRRVVLGDTLLANYTVDEIEVIFAHELGHHRHRDIAKAIAVQAGLTLLAFFVAAQALPALTLGLGLAGPTDLAALPLLALMVGALDLVTTPLTSWLSRAWERAADEHAIKATGKAWAFEAGMTRLSNQNLTEIEPPRWAELLLHSHPSIGSRLRHARAAATEA